MPADVVGHDGGDSRCDRLPSSSSRQIVTCPTRTPGTSVMALCSPTGREPNERPQSRARGRGGGAGMIVIVTMPPGAARRFGDRAGLRMPVVWSERHRGHQPDGGYWLGVREAGDEEPVRGDRPARRTARRRVHDRRTARPRPRSGAPGPRSRLRRLPVPCLPGMGRRGTSHGSRPTPRGAAISSPPPGSRAHRCPTRRPASIRAELGLYAMDTMSLMSAGTFDAALAATHAAAHAADMVSQGTPASYAAVRPPGHHAGPAFFGGSCYLNNAAVAAARLRDNGSRAGLDRRHRRAPGQRHPGDLLGAGRRGCTPASTSTRPTGWFPHLVGYADETGGGPGEGWNRNVPVSGGHGRRTMAGCARPCDCAGHGARLHRARGVARGRRRGRRSRGTAGRHRGRLPRGRRSTRPPRPPDRVRAGGRLRPHVG